jgi:uncharacterized membrane protein YebE (DUF533 family)
MPCSRRSSQDSQTVYPLANRQKALAALKAMALMAKADDQVDEKEKTVLQAFAKTLGLTKEQWKQILSELDLATVFEPFGEKSRNDNGSRPTISKRSKHF